MRKIFTQLYQLLITKRIETVESTGLNRDLLNRDLENCLTINDIEILNTVLEDCQSDFTRDQWITFLLNVSYRKKIINFCDQNLNCKRYPIVQLRNMFRTANSIAYCDAILLHVKRNLQHYTNDYFTPEFDRIPAVTDMALIYEMADNRRAFLWNSQFNPNTTA